MDFLNKDNQDTLQPVSGIVSKWERDGDWRISPGVEWCKKGYRVQIGNGTFISKNAQIGNQVTIGDLCMIFSDTTIGDETNIGNFCAIGPYSSIGKVSILGRDIIIKSNSIIGDYVVIGPKACIDQNTFIETRSIISASVYIREGILIYHDVIVRKEAAIPTMFVIGFLACPCAPNMLRIGCTVHTVEDWLENLNEYMQEALINLAFEPRARKEIKWLASWFKAFPNSLGWRDVSDE